MEYVCGRCATAGRLILHLYLTIGSQINTAIAEESYHMSQTVQAIKITVKLFAAFQEAIATSEIVLDMAVGSAVSEVYDQLVLQYPHLEKWRSLTRFAINLDFVDSKTILEDGDEIALIPPVSGG